MSRRLEIAIRLALAALSFVLYAAASISLHQARTAVFINEENGPLLPAMSRRLYGTPFGLVDSAFNDDFVKIRDTGIPAEQAVAEALKGEIPPSGELRMAWDGTGIGGILAGELSFMLFGPHAKSLTYFYLFLIGLSCALFAVRFPDQRLTAVPILLTALTLLLLTPLTEGESLQQAPIGGIRYYAIVGALPVLHWCFELTDGRSSEHHGVAVRCLLLGAQLPILVLGLLVRGSPVYLLLPLIGFAAVALWRGGKTWRRPVATVLLVPAVVVTVGTLLLVDIGFPDYVKDGREFPNVWHRAFIGLGLNPHWPFPGVREEFKCPDIAEGIVQGPTDRNGHCVWWAYAIAHKMPVPEMMDKVYGSEYEGAMRDAYFWVLRNYPYQVFQTYAYYKPELIWTTWRDSLPTMNLPAARQVAPLAAVQFLVLLALVMGWPPPAPLSDAAIRLGILVPFLIGVVFPLLIAWAAPHTIIDLLAYSFCAALSVLWFAVAVVMRLGLTAGRLLLAR